jgi:Zn-dependent peptidase ImmA (M78 family)
MQLTYDDMRNIVKIQEIADKYKVSVKTVYFACFYAEIIDSRDQLKTLCEECNITYEKGDTFNNYNEMLDSALRNNLIDEDEFHYMRGYC